MKNLQGRVAVVTGAGSGIGRATAELLAERGCAIALVEIDPDRLRETADTLRATGASVSQHLVDVSDALRMQALPGEVIAEHGAVHIVVNNAGVTVLKTFAEHSLDDLQWLVGINFWGVVYGCKFFLPELMKADEAHIVNISSMFGFVGAPGQSSYCATKFAVRGFTESLWAELQDTPIGVTSIHPGGIATNAVKGVRASSDEARAALQRNFDKYGHPPDDVARAIVKAIEGDRLRMIVGIEAFIVEWMKRLMPVWTHKLLAQRLDPLA